jgi:hypothetical protein
VLLAIENFLERIDLGLRLRLQVEHHVAVHRHEAPVRIVGEARVPGQGDETLHRLVIEPKVQHGVHHAGHGGPRTGAHRHQERVGRVAEAAPDELLDAVEVLGDRVTQPARVAAAVGVEVGAHVRRDREPGRHRQAERRHLRQVGAFPAEQCLHCGVAIRPAAAEGVHEGGPLGASLGRSARGRLGLLDEAPMGFSRCWFLPCLSFHALVHLLIEEPTAWVRR